MKRSRSRWKKVPGAGVGQNRTGSATLLLHEGKVGHPPMDYTAVRAYFGTLITQILPLRNRNLTLGQTFTKEMFPRAAGPPTLDTIMIILDYALDCRECCVQYFNSAATYAPANALTSVAASCGSLLTQKLQLPLIEPLNRQRNPWVSHYWLYVTLCNINNNITERNKGGWVGI